MKTIRLHKNLVLAVIDTLDVIFNRGIYADKAVERKLRSNKKWGSRDRSFIAETVYDLVRWKRLYAKIANMKEPFQREDLFKLFGVWSVLKEIDLPAWSEFENFSLHEIESAFLEFSKIRKYRESIPDWLDERGLSYLGDQLWSEELSALNEPAQVVLRTNTLKTTREELQDLLQESKIETTAVQGSLEALVLQKRSRVTSTDLYKKGFFEIQDANSQRVAHFVEPQPGMFVIDACAGAGGKSLHLACLMKNQGHIRAMDISSDKLSELTKRAQRGGVEIIETGLVNSEIIKDLADQADRVLIDAPCSSLGVLRRMPDTKWKLDPGQLERIIQQQGSILRNYATMVKPGGKLVYATCSILAEENDEQVQRFLISSAGKKFSLEKEEHCWASKTGFDGFYMARFLRSN